MIKFDFETYMPAFQFSDYEQKISDIKNNLEKKNNMCEWYERQFDKGLLDKIKNVSKDIRENCDAFLVIGIGGSFLGAKAVIDALAPYFKHNEPEVIFVGTSISGSYLENLTDYIANKRVIINVISKSGTTLEPMITFNYLLDIMKEKYKTDYQKRIIVTTDKSEGLLRELANKEGFTAFEIPDQIGGRYSMFTPAGLLPICVAGINIDELLKGVKDCDINDAFKYAMVRDQLYKKNKLVESFAIYEPKLYFYTEWLKQLFCETQDKNQKGLFATSTVYTRDLHSLGQFFQEGNRIVFETVLMIKNTNLLVNKNYNKSFDEINIIASESVAKAHKQVDCYSNIITMDELTAYELGYLSFFFMVAAACGAYFLEVNPFDQPGVNAYKSLIKNSL